MIEPTFIYLSGWPREHGHQRWLKPWPKLNPRYFSGVKDYYRHKHCTPSRPSIHQALHTFPLSSIIYYLLFRTFLCEGEWYLHLVDEEAEITFARIKLSGRTRIQTQVLLNLKPRVPTTLCIFKILMKMSDSNTDWNLERKIVRTVQRTFFPLNHWQVGCQHDVPSPLCVSYKHRPSPTLLDTYIKIRKLALIQYYVSIFRSHLSFAKCSHKVFNIKRTPFQDVPTWSSSSVSLDFSPWHFWRLPVFFCEMSRHVGLSDVSSGPDKGSATLTVMWCGGEVMGWWSHQELFCFVFRWNLGKTYNIVLGSGQVVLGMDMGLREMCVGEKRTVIIPPHLGYGEAGVGE